MTENRPTFFIVGAPKCGTTALCAYLAQHPEILIPKVKEPNFFGVDLTGAVFTRDQQEYLRLFMAEGEKIAGEGSTWYLYSRLAAQEIFDFDPMAKIIIILREPVELLYSLHNQLVYDGRNENITDFVEALLAEPDRMSGKRIPKGCLRKEALYYSQVPRFRSQIERYRRFFPDEQIHYILYEQFAEDPLGEYLKVLRFLDVKLQHFVPEMKVVNGSKFVKNQFVNRLKNQPLVKGLSRMLLPDTLVGHLKKEISKRNTVYKARPELDRSFAYSLQQQYLDDIDYLSQLLNQDLSNWLNRYRP